MTTLSIKDGYDGAEVSAANNEVAFEMAHLAPGVGLGWTVSERAKFVSPMVGCRTARSTVVTEPSSPVQTSKRITRQGAAVMSVNLLVDRFVAHRHRNIGEHALSEHQTVKRKASSPQRRIAPPAQSTATVSNAVVGSHHLKPSAASRRQLCGMSSRLRRVPRRCSQEPRCVSCRSYANPPVFSVTCRDELRNHASAEA